MICKVTEQFLGKQLILATLVRQLSATCTCDYCRGCHTHTHTHTHTHSPHSHNLTGYTLYTLPPPSGGVDLLFPLNVLSSYDHHDPTSHGNRTLTYHRLVEAFKYMFALRSQLGDTDCEGCNGSAVRGVVDDMIRCVWVWVWVWVGVGVGVGGCGCGCVCMCGWVCACISICHSSTDYAASIRESISDKETHNLSYYHAHYATPPNDHGTTHVSVLGPDGMAVSVTS